MLTSTTSEETQTSREAAAMHGFLEETSRALMGDIYTIIDASFSDPVQRKAVKDLVRERYHVRIWRVDWQRYYDGRWTVEQSTPDNSQGDPNVN